MEEVPIAYIKEIEVGRDGIRALIIDCPLCGEEHLHGGGSVDEDLKSYFGHRAAHCLSPEVGKGGYILALPDGGLSEVKQSQGAE